MKLKIIGTVFLFVWAISAAYFGVGSLIYEDSKDALNKLLFKPADADDTLQVMGFANRKAYESSLKIEEIQKWEEKLWWVSDTPGMVNLLIGSSAFCLIGVIIRVIMKVVFEKIELTSREYFAEPLLGLFTGFVVLSISYLIPSVLTQNITDVKPVSLMLLSVLVGIFIEDFYKRISKYFTNKIISE